MSIAVIGAGLIGRAWAIVFARAGFKVAFWDGIADAVPTPLAKIKARIDDLMAALMAYKRRTERDEE